MKVWKRYLAGLLAAFICIFQTGCSKKEKDISRFGMDINELNPLVMTATDWSAKKTVFSRDPSIISEVTQLFENMKLKESTKPFDENGISFTVSTMFGDFAFGECLGNRLRLNGKDYILDRDYSKNIQLLYNRLESEAAHTCNVSRETILSITPDMTYRQLLDMFGDTLQTAVVSEKKAFLYQYNGRPFYIVFKKDTDNVGMSGQQLLEEIFKNYNLRELLTTPPPLKSGCLSVYVKAFDRILDKAFTGNERPTEIVLDTRCLVRLSNQERQKLTDHLREQYSVAVMDSSLADMYAADDAVQKKQFGRFIVWVKYYTYIGSNKITFVAAGRQVGNKEITQPMDFNLKDSEWRG